MNKKPAVQILRTGSLWDLAEAVGCLFGTPAADAATDLFRVLAHDYRLTVRGQGQVDWMQYLLQLLLTCPVLLQRPPGFEWVTDELRSVFHTRKFNHEVDRDFWQALEQVRALSPKGRPRNKARDWFRCEWVYHCMYPVTTSEEYGLVRTKGMRKSQAVAKVADMEARWYGRRPAEREIWRSLKRVEQYLRMIREEVKAAAPVSTSRPQQAKRKESD